MKKFTLFLFFIFLILSCKKKEIGELETGIYIENDLKKIISKCELIPIDKNELNNIKKNKYFLINDYLIEPIRFDFDENKKTLIITNSRLFSVFGQVFSNYNIKKLNNKFIIKGTLQNNLITTKNAIFIFDFKTDICYFSDNIFAEIKEKILWIDKNKNLLEKIQKSRKDYLKSILQEYKKIGFDIIGNDFYFKNYNEDIKVNSFKIYNVEDSKTGKMLENYYVIEIGNNFEEKPEYVIELDEDKKEAKFSDKNINYVPGGYWLE